MNTKQTSSSTLWNNVVGIISQLCTISFAGSNPYRIKIDDKVCFIFIRNLTRAYSDRSPDVCRIQLPRSIHFNEIAKSYLPLMVIGYCQEHNTFAIWDSDAIKQRLNKCRNVSLYSRFSEQNLQELQNASKVFELKTGEKIQILKEDDLPFKIYETAIVPASETDDLSESLDMFLKAAYDNGDDTFSIIPQVFTFFSGRGMPCPTISEVKDIITKFHSKNPPQPH